jgi:hypothetical protein
MTTNAAITLFAAIGVALPNQNRKSAARREKFQGGCRLPARAHAFIRLPVNESNKTNESFVPLPGQA